MVLHLVKKHLDFVEIGGSLPPSKKPERYPIHSQLNPVNIATTHFFKISFIIICYLCQDLTNCIIRLKFWIYFSSRPRAACIQHLVLCDYITFWRRAPLYASFSISLFQAFSQAQAFSLVSQQSRCRIDYT
jgi:hypothetical protein